MVIADGGAEEVVGEAGGVQDDLGAAEHSFIFILLEAGLGDEGGLEVGRELEYCGGAGGELAVYGYSEA